MFITNKYLILGIFLFAFSCKKVKNHVEPIIINTILNSEQEIEFRKKDLNTLYPKLLTPENFDAENDTFLIKKIKTFQNKLVYSLKSKKINWNVADTEINILTRIYFDSIGQIEYFTFKINNKDVKLSAIEEFKSLLEMKISDINLGIERKTKYNHCVNFKLPVEN